MELPKTYNPREFEERIYKDWVEKGYFKPRIDKNKKPFTIVMPPPNITGQLHLGHALDNTMQDILIRWKRMQGIPTLWVPGTDHASIATEVKIVEMLKEEGLTKEQIGREEFLRRAWQWKEKYGSRIVEQLKRLGTSCDWSRERFTMDEQCSKAVKRFFVRLYNKGLIYRGDRIINWCPDCKTALSDAEVEHKEEEGHLWYIRYPFKDGSGYVMIATTRPETMIGDTAVAVNPKDERYKDAVGKTLVLPIVGREIPVIADDYVDMEFGTGAVKVTPAHDPNDFECGIRHNLPQVQVIGEDGRMTEEAGKYRGLDRYEARAKVVEELKEQGFLEKIEKITHSVGHCYRCDTVIEPLISKQWFVKMKPLVEPALKVVADGKVKIVPDRFTKVYNNWLENIKDWCISRQLWWGHRIPAWYCDSCGEITVAEEEPDRCQYCGGTDIHQDEDVLDTWFSSGLWPFSTLGWPDDTDDLRYFYPTSVLVTGYDIIFFWVARMIFSGLEAMGDIPFEYVLIHGLIRDAEGRKMSKSLGNGIDPIEVIDRYGADTLRFTLATNNSPGNDIRFSWERVEASRNFANKLWNATRFALLNMEIDRVIDIPYDVLDLSDKWILSRLNNLIKEVNANLERFELGLAASKLYDFIWSEFCDWYIEASKARLYGGNVEEKRACEIVLRYVLDNTLRLLHPFMPFITEELWQQLPHEGDSIMIAPWPEYSETMEYKEEEESFNILMDVVRCIRNIRAEEDVPPAKRIKAIIHPATDKVLKTIESGLDYIKKLGNVQEVDIVMEQPEDKRMRSMVLTDMEIYIPLSDLIDIDKEIEKLNNEKKKIESEIERSTNMLSNEGFVKKAPPQVVENERQKLVKYRETLNKLVERIKTLTEW
ncbi:valine--tRNA ligase [Calorimonas adulescens]|uniref:Valine--tRNA ligase n=1 Tax=Calorimonas adulescens TaxID=2606906 RepID=A0A5D8QD46_9THEO|nr:valine--tRNA ligase [Calorimonas adulescens]TZE81726.1 valine--tRNA ligase [Calorimonas adulescens]